MATTYGSSDLLDQLVAEYGASFEKVKLFQEQVSAALLNSAALQGHVHSMKFRLKEFDHLREKLARKMAECEEKGFSFEITPDNLLTRITDLAGVRILHLYTRQIRDIDREIRAILEEQQYALLEGPFARTWDDESRAFFDSCGIETELSPSMYTSVHYVVGSASRTTVTCEIQVRTLMEEVWGEVDHQLNYPQRSDVLAVTEQLKVLARVTSSATRLVDSIFLTHEDSSSSAGEP